MGSWLVGERWWDFDDTASLHAWILSLIPRVPRAGTRGEVGNPFLSHRDEGGREPALGRLREGSLSSFIVKYKMKTDRQEALPGELPAGVRREDMGARPACVTTRVFLFPCSFNVRFCLRADGKGTLPAKLSKCPRPCPCPRPWGSRELPTLRTQLTLWGQESLGLLLLIWMFSPQSLWVETPIQWGDDTPVR